MTIEPTVQQRHLIEAASNPRGISEWEWDTRVLRAAWRNGWLMRCNINGQVRLIATRKGREALAVLCE